MAKVILHIDLNYFFVRCEELKDPSIINKPVMIGSTGRCGIVSTCSYAARKFGVKSGQPGYIAKKLCPDIIMLPVDFKYYELMSNEFFHYVRQYTHKIEGFSLDECYVDVTSLVNKNTDINKFLLDFQNGLFKKTGLYCSIGVGTTKFIAKMASDMKKPMGITIIRNKEIKDKLFNLDVSSFFGIGKKTAPRLKAIGVNTIGDLYNFVSNDKDNDIIGDFKKYIKDCLEGKSDDDVSPLRSDPKSIGNSSTLDHDTDDFVQISNVIREISQTLSYRIKQEKKKAKTIQITIKDSNFKSYNKSLTLEKPIDSIKDILNSSLDIYKKFFLNKQIRLVGVSLQNLVEKYNDDEQLTFFNYENFKDKEYDLIRYINKKFDKNVVSKAKDILKKH